MILYVKKRLYVYTYKMSSETLKKLTASYSPSILFRLSPWVQIAFMIWNFNLAIDKIYTRVD